MKISSQKAAGSDPVKVVRMLLNEQEIELLIPFSMASGVGSWIVNWC